MFKKISHFFKSRKGPLKIRTKAESELQDAFADPKTRSPEREAFDRKTYEQAKKELKNPARYADQEGANPNRDSH